jgi:hypothetical protein
MGYVVSPQEDVVRILVFLALVLGVGTSVQAQDLTYRWEPGEVIHYRLQAYVKAPRILHFVAAENLDARVVELTIGLELDCTPGEPGRRDQDWECEVHRVQLGGMAFEGEQEKLDAIFEEYTTLLSESQLQLEWSLHGRLKTVDIEGFSKRNDREQTRYEYLRLLIQRVLAALELELPKNGDASEAWRQKGSPLALRLPTRFGTAGGMRLDHEVLANEGGQVAIQSVGRGTVSSGQSIESGVDNAVSMSLLGKAVFDVKSGVLVRNELSVQGALNTSSSGATDGFYLSQFILAEKVDTWEEAEAAPLEIPVEEAAVVSEPTEPEPEPMEPESTEPESTEPESTDDAAVPVEE